jgi:hypothetical protein
MRVNAVPRMIGQYFEARLLRRLFAADVSEAYVASDEDSAQFLESLRDT